MGTRALTRVFDDGRPIIHLYRQMDGYPEGHGHELRAAVGHLRLVNGLQDSDPHVANGMGCFAAQLVAALKTEPGGFYLFSPNRDEDLRQYDYVYDLYDNNSVVTLKVTTDYRVLYYGPLNEFSVDKIDDKEEDEQVRKPVKKRAKKQDSKKKTTKKTTKKVSKRNPAR